MRSKGHDAARRSATRGLLLLLPLLAASCAGLSRNDQGNLQPQTVRGSCQVKKFFILSFTSVRTGMTTGNAGSACAFTVLNPALQVVLNAALVTNPPSHGRATATLISGDRQAEVSYTPQPGYVGSDRFSVTLEPNALGITVDVAVQPTPPAS